MPLTAGLPNTEYDVVVRIEVGKRLDILEWTPEADPNGLVFSRVITEGEPTAVWGKVKGITTDPIKYEEVGSIALCQATASSWYYNSSTLYLHTTTGTAPDSSDHVLMSLFWKSFGTGVMDVDGVPCEPLLDKKTIPAITQEISLSSAGGSRTAFGAIKLKNYEYFFCLDLNLYEYQAKLMECWVGDAGTAFSGFTQYFTGWSGDIELDDYDITIGIEDVRFYVR
jgi:hypothetical protein